MSLYVIADLHLSTLDTTNKSMEVFGRRWDGYMTRIKNNWERLVTDEDTVVIPGDVSWALSLEEAVSDLKFIDSLPGKKILGKGNHDFWWCTMKKHEALFEKHGITTLSFLFNNAHGLFKEEGKVVFGHHRGVVRVKRATGANQHAVKRFLLQQLLCVCIIRHVRAAKLLCLCAAGVQRLRNVHHSAKGSFARIYQFFDNAANAVAVADNCKF